MDMVSTNRRGVTKQVKRLQGRLGPGKSKATVKDKRIKNAVGNSCNFKYKLFNAFSHYVVNIQDTRLMYGLEFQAYTQLAPFVTKKSSISL